MKTCSLLFSVEDFLEPLFIGPLNELPERVVARANLLLISRVLLSNFQENDWDALIWPIAEQDSHDGFKAIERYLH
jgi:hypothetical protein